MEELWKDVSGYEGIYQISNFGKLRSFINGKVRYITPTKTPCGYLQFKLYKDHIKKYFYAHRLVMNEFSPIENSKNFQVNHKDENKSNNNIENLEWVTHKENCNYGNRNKKISQFNLNRKDQSKKVLCVETNIIYPSIAEAQRQTNINSSNIIKVCCGVFKTSGGYHWKYVLEV